MKIHGGGQVLTYGPEEEGPHPIGDHPFWQESVVLVWWDTNNHIGGVHRIGHEPFQAENGGGQVSLWNHLFSKNEVFKRSVTLPLREGDRPGSGFNCGDDSCIFDYTDHAIWRINDNDVQAELHISDAHTPVDIYPKKNSLGEDFAPNHMEVGGTISGTLTLKGTRYDVNGLCFRDHGWGIRKWDTLISHRWIAGTFGKDFSFLVTAFHTSDDDIGGFGCVMRDNELIYSQNVDVLTSMEIDGLSHRGGQITMELTTGEKLLMHCQPLQQGVVSWIHGIACVDTLCEVRLKGSNRRGICDFETTNNALRGKHQPQAAVNAITANGWHSVGPAT